MDLKRVITGVGSYRVSAEIEGKEVGSATVVTNFDDDHITKLEMLRVSEGFRGRGISHNLIDEAIKISKEVGEFIWLNATPVGYEENKLTQSQLVKLYESHGFEVFETYPLCTYMINYHNERKGIKY